MESIESAITIIALVATAFSCGVAGAESITVKMESVREDSVEHLFQPSLRRALGGPQLVEGLPETQSVAGLEIHEPLHARLSFEDSPAEPIVIVGQDNDGQDIAFAVADSTAQPQQLQLTSDFFDRIRDDALYTEMTVPPAGQAPEFKVELLINRGKYNAVLHRNLELRLGEADIGGQRYAIALVRDPGFGTYTLPPDSLGPTLHQLMIDRDGDGVFLTHLYGQTEVLEDEVFGVNEPFLIDDQTYKLAHVSATGDQLVIERSDQTVALAVGFEMPNVTVTRLDSSAIDTALRGKPVVINWWQTFCPPCITEIPELNELVEKYADRDIEFLAIANNEMAELTPFLEKHQFTFDIALADDEAVHVFGQGYPRHVIIDGDGKVVYDVHGYSPDTTDRIDAVIGSLLSEL